MKTTRQHAPVSGARGLLSVLCLLLAGAAVAAPVGSPLQRPALPAVQAERSYMLGIAQAGERLVAVGERGIIVLSNDKGAHWRQVQTPVSVTLTGVRFADQNRGYAVGHGGSVLITADGGETWALSLDGDRAAQIILAAAQARGDARSIAAAKRLVAEGADKPLLDVLVRDAQHVFVVGGYGLALYTADGGQSWNAWLSPDDNPGGMHLNAIRGDGDRILIVGEQGLVLLSDNGGSTFRTLEPPYSGSFFTAELLANDGLMVAGLRGNTLRSDDAGSTWTSLQSPVEASITASAIQPDGQILLANQAGMLLREQGGRLIPVNKQPLPPVNNLLPTTSAGIYVLSDQGVSSLTVGDKQ
ncbi:BNR domain-containing protein [Pseudomonas cichorii]|uniref:BNR domain-containing protein n=1 Tax=Pseudomonas cichorii TaxID=36746 RepID=A0A3M4M8N3_PSECI|nr:YCF48-related protein [Pseudomonas cichorii]RMQ49521.1 BNR domain-containing protein [Pseudomonas cichorii]